MNRKWNAPGSEMILLRLKSVLALVLILTLSGCAAGRSTRVYDSTHHDWHEWNASERRAYVEYWHVTGQAYRDYGALSEAETKAYWDWRHTRESE
jgi:hypothetical protein